MGEKRTARAIWLWELAAIGMALSAVVLRCLQWAKVFTPQGVILPGVDTYYHLWRARLLLDHFPASPLFDPYISFPSGGPIPYPPLFDLLVAGPGFLGAGFEGLASWGALLPPLLGGLAVYLTYRLGTLTCGRPVGLTAALFLALFKGHLFITFVGRLDHHALVAPVILGLLIVFVRALRAERPRSAIAWALAVGPLTGVAVASWPVTPMAFFLPLPAALVLAGLSGRGREAGRVALWSMGSMMVFVLLAVLASTDLSIRPLDLYLPSWFTVIAGALAGPLAALACYRPRSALILSGAAALGLGLIFTGGGGQGAVLQQASEVLSGADPVYRFIGESYSIFSAMGHFSLTPAVSSYSYLFLLWPVMCAAYLWRMRVRRDGRAERWLVLNYLVLGCGLIVIQRRFGEFGAPAVALLFAWGLWRLGRSLVDGLGHSVHPLRGRILGGLLALSVLTALWPLPGGVALHLRDDQFGDRAFVIPFLQNLDRVLPVTDPVQPQYGVLTMWKEAHPLLAVSGRPVVISNFGTLEASRGNRLGYGLWLSRDEAEAYESLRTRRIRYLLVKPSWSQFAFMAALAGVPQDFVFRVSEVRGDQVVEQIQPLAPYAETLYARLLMGDGSQTPFGQVVLEPLSHLRLIVESAEKGREFHFQAPLLKLFEVVPGARLVGRAPAGELIRLRLTVRTNTGREFLYRREARAGEDGVYSLVVPYATEAVGTPCAALGPYRLKVGSRVLHQEVSEAAVGAGLQVLVEGTDPPAIE